MHVLFVHQNFPAQFGHIAKYLAEEKNFRCTFVSEKPGGKVGAIEMIQYKPRGGATANTHYCSRTFENATWHTFAVYEALRNRPDIQPDLIVGHSGFGSTLYLRELYDCPIVNYFEYFYRTKNSDMDFRPDFPSREIDKLRARSRNAMIMLDMENCDIGYSPTKWQNALFPQVFQDKLRVIFDGVDLNIWKPEAAARQEPRKLGELTIPEGVKVVTYATRGMESMRGFDIFMKVAKRLCDMRNDVVFLIAGQDRVCYGGDERFTQGKTFKEWITSQDNYDLSRFRFLGLVPPAVLSYLFSLTDLHIYLTVPFVLSWSVMNALACGTTLLASSTSPVQEMITHEQNGLLVDFFDVDGFVEQANRVLDNPNDFRHLGEAGVEMIRKEYSLDVCLPKMLELYEEARAEYSKN
ncbi:MAG: glycosyltransferase [Gemmataceae bacterium]